VAEIREGVSASHFLRLFTNMTYLAKLKSATTLNDVANLLGVKPSALAFVLYKIPNENRYVTFTVPKKSGGERTISAPNARLKLIQSRLGKLLEQCQLEVEAALKVKRQCVLAHGFRTGFSIQTNAVNHRARRWVFNTDLQDFFPSINFGRVYGFFIKNKHYLLHKRVATIISQISCHDNKLPQGSPCSPVISNIIAHLLDIRLNELATSRGCTYTRYADDLTFSTNERTFPSAIAKRDPEDLHRWLAGIGLVGRIAKAGFAINAQKSRMQYCDSRQEATGLVVNERINVKKEDYKFARAMCRELVTMGAAYERVGEVLTTVENDRLRGKLAFIYHVKRWDDARRNVPTEETKNSNYHRVYADFLNYISFFGQKQATVVCEGKTDNVYLRCALRSLASDYPTLIQVRGSTKTLLVQLFKFTKTAADVQNISGGASQLSNLLSNYRKMIGSFRGIPEQPTILLVDNDSGPKKLFLHLSNLSSTKAKKVEVDGSEPYYFVYENLYVVPVPKVGGAFTAMEHLFKSEVLATKLGSRILDLSNKETDVKRFYSKNDFSVEVIQKNQSSIDFRGFKPLLDAIVAVQKDYSTKAMVAKAAAAAKVVRASA
jgi:RNA-directed DNA polymerase